MTPHSGWSLASPVPVVHATRLQHLMDHYCRTLGFVLRTQVPHVVAFLSMGEIALQLWQTAGAPTRRCHIDLGPKSAFQVYGDLRRVARSALVEDRPQLQPWGAWEFTLCDPEGNLLRFSQQLALGAGYLDRSARWTRRTNP